MYRIRIAIATSLMATTQAVQKQTAKDPFIDLEAHTHQSILMVKQIKLHDYPHAFNPSIIRWNGSLLLCFRVIPDPKRSFESWLGLVWLNEQFEPVSMPQKLQTRDPHSPVPSRIDDGRLIAVNNRLYLVYSDNEDRIISKGGFRVYIAEITFDGATFSVHDIEKIHTFENNSLQRREKNWVPFEYAKTLLLAYSISPHRILKPIRGTGRAETLVTTLSKLSWDWGELRGGTTGLLEGAHYLSFFHSAKRMASVHSQGQEMLHYFIGAYLFSKHAPFTITHISPEPIIGKGFYHGAEYKPYWAPVRAVFPCGFVMDKECIWIVYGRQDHEMWVAQLDKNLLYASLVPVL